MSAIYAFFCWIFFSLSLDKSGLKNLAIGQFQNFVTPGAVCLVRAIFADINVTKVNLVWLENIWKIFVLFVAGPCFLWTTDFLVHLYRFSCYNNKLKDYPWLLKDHPWLLERSSLITSVLVSSLLKDYL